MAIVNGQTRLCDLGILGDEIEYLIALFLFKTGRFCVLGVWRAISGVIYGSANLFLRSQLNVRGKGGELKRVCLQEIL